MQTPCQESQFLNRSQTWSLLSQLDDLLRLLGIHAFDLSKLIRGD